MFTVLRVRRYTRERLVRYIHFIHDIHLWPPGERLRVVFAVTDQFAKEYRTPPLLFPLWLDWPDKGCRDGAICRIAVAIREKALSPEHRDVATRLENYRRYEKDRPEDGGNGGPLSLEQLSEFKKFHGQPVTHFPRAVLRDDPGKPNCSPTSSGNGSGGITFANVIETLAQLRG